MKIHAQASQPTGGSLTIRAGRGSSGVVPVPRVWRTRLRRYSKLTMTLPPGGELYMVAWLEHLLPPHPNGMRAVELRVLVTHYDAFDTAWRLQADPIALAMMFDGLCYPCACHQGA